MVIRHGGLTAAERVKKAVEVCKDRCSPYCPYWTEDECRTLILTDCAEAIAERDERIAIMQESMESLEKRYEPNIMPLADVMGWMGETDESREPIYWENRFEKYENQWLLKPENPLYMINAIKAGRARAWTQKPTEEQSKAVKWE